MVRRYTSALWLLVLVISTGPVVSGQPDCSGCHDVDRARFGGSVHGSLACTDCHAGAASVPHEAAAARADCSACHGDIVEALAASSHTHARDRRSNAEMTCSSCHGTLHFLVPSSSASSPVHASRQPATCGACHAGDEAGAPAGRSVVRPVEAYQESVHARAQREGRGATCASCHGSHSVKSAGDPSSTTYRRNIPDTCGVCHGEIAAKFKASIHGVAAGRGAREAPVCTDCHGEHRILSSSEPDSPTFETNVARETCERCHADTRLGRKYGLPLDRVPSYASSYHGLAARAGVQSVANCASCHGVHDIRPSSDPRSQVHPANLAETCGRCHPGAGKRFDIGPIHVTATDSPGSAAHWIRAIYLPLIFLVIGGMLLHNVLDLWRKARSARARRIPDRAPVQERMSLGFRAAHLLVTISFPILVYTGFALTYPESFWARPILRWESSIGLRGWLHRVAGVVLTLTLAGHWVHVAISRRARRCIAGMRPTGEDWRELVRRARYFVGRGPAPHGIRLGYVEKSEYWAFAWGTVLMAVTGLVLWFENVSLRWLPSWVLQAATAVHFYEAVLASLAILVWHLYWVVFDPQVYPMDTAWLTGRAPAARAEERGEAPPDS